MTGPGRKERSLWPALGGSHKSDWFRKGGASTVITVHSAVNSKLASKVREALKAAPDPTSCNTLVREQPGPSFRQSLVRNDLEPRSSCGRNLCPFKQSGEQCKMRRDREGMLYAGRFWRATCTSWKRVRRSIIFVSGATLALPLFT